MSPSFQAAVRFIAVIGVEWSTLTLIESAPVWVKIATFILAVAVLGTLEFRSWLQSRGKWAFATLLGGLIAVYLIVFALALFWTAPAWALFVTVFPWLLAAFGVLGIASGLYRAIAVEKALPSSVRLASAIDTQTRLDLIHLLDFAAMQASHAMLRRLIDLAFEPPIREAFGVGEHSQEAQELAMVSRICQAGACGLASAFRFFECSLRHSGRSGAKCRTRSRKRRYTRRNGLGAPTANNNRIAIRPGNSLFARSKARTRRKHESPKKRPCGQTKSTAATRDGRLT